MRESLQMPQGLDGDLVRQHLPGYLHHRHSHDELEMNLVLQGEATYLIGQRICRITRGTMVWLFPGQEHQVVSKSDDYTVWIGYWRAAAVARTCPAGGDAAVLTKADPSGWFSRRIGEVGLRRLDRLIAEIQATAADRFHHRAGMAYLLLTLWAAFRSASDLPAGTLLHPAVENACRHLGDGGGSDLRALARSSGLSYQRLSLLFRRELGATLGEYRNRCRLDRFLARHDPSRQRLLDSALDAGFGSYAQFHRVFTSLIGTSPQAWSREPFLQSGKG